MDNFALLHIPIAGEFLGEVVQFGCVFLPIKIMPLFTSHLERTTQQASGNLAEWISDIEYANQFFAEAGKSCIYIPIVCCGITLY